MPMILRALLPSSPLASVLADIQRCIDAKLYYPVLLIALTVPEICSALALDNTVLLRPNTTFRSSTNIRPQKLWDVTGKCVIASAAASCIARIDNIFFTVPESTSGYRAYLSL
jgi:hypothetical protein